MENGLLLHIASYHSQSINHSHTAVGKPLDSNHSCPSITTGPLAITSRQGGWLRQTEQESNRKLTNWGTNSKNRGHRDAACYDSSITNFNWSLFTRWPLNAQSKLSWLKLLAHLKISANILKASNILPLFNSHARLIVDLLHKIPIQYSVVCGCNVTYWEKHSWTWASQGFCETLLNTSWCFL